jgi:hypothetical protein
MAKYKITKMNTGFGEFLYTVNRIDTFKDHFSGMMITDLIPVQPIKYFKTLAGAEREVKRLENR